MEYVVLFNLVSQAYYLTVCVLCGCILKSMTAALAFFLAFNLLRRYSGGVHASTEMRCTVMSTLMIVAVLIGVKLIPFEMLSLRLIFSLTSFPIIALLAPVAAPEKPLSDKRKRINKCKAIIVSIIELTIIIVYGNRNVTGALTAAMTVQAVLLVLGMIKNKRLQKSG